MTNSDEESVSSSSLNEDYKQQDEMASDNTSFNNSQRAKFVVLIPQIIATLISSSYHIVVGITLAYSAILIPQLRNTTIFSTANTTISHEQQEAWIASTTIIIVPIASLICGISMDYLGRLNTLKLATIPVTLGWILIATAQTYSMILIGRILVGVSIAFATNPAIVYVTEIADPEARGALMSTGPAYASLGTVLVYVKGYFMNWRTIAWICNIWTILPCALMFCIPESPPWYISKGKNDKAGDSLKWLHKNQPQPPNKTQTVAQLQLELLIKDQEKKQAKQNANDHAGVMTQLKEFTKPTVIKPFIILQLLFFFQQCSGIYIIIFYAIDIFKELGSNINPYIISIFTGIVRLLMSITNTYLQIYFSRRSLMMVSCLGMTICMFLSNLFSIWIIEDNNTLAWLQVLCFVLHVITSMIGLLPIPWMLTAELFPLEIRGMAQCLSHTGAQIIMFLAVQSFPSLVSTLGNILRTQWFFGVMSLLGMIYTYIFLPETHGKKLNDIAEYFVDNTVYLSSKKVKKTNVPGLATIEVNVQDAMIINEHTNQRISLKL